MQDIIKELRSALELQHAIQGTLVPLGSNDTATSDAVVDQAVTIPVANQTAKPVPTPAPEKKPAPIPAPVQPASPTVVVAANGDNPASSARGHVDAPTIIKTQAPAGNSANADLFGNAVDPARDTSLPPTQRIGALIPADSPLHAMHTLEEVASYVANNVLMPLDAQRMNPVFGVGNPDSDLLVIGEAPGADEDKQGEPFVGRAGQLLNKILAAINFARQDVYIANILKSRPPNNRDPQPEEIAAHIPILYKQITLIKPKLILCVGKTAGNTLLKKNSSLGALRGKFNDFYGIPTMVTYHPAALLRNQQWKRPTWEDVQLLRQKYDELAG